jgi:hypothetical protein
MFRDCALDVLLGWAIIGLVLVIAACAWCLP